MLGPNTHLREFLKGDDSKKVTLDNNFLLSKICLPFSVLVQIFFLFSEISVVNGLILVLHLSSYGKQRSSVQLYPGLRTSSVISSRIFFCCGHISDVTLEAEVQAHASVATQIQNFSSEMFVKNFVSFLCPKQV